MRISQLSFRPRPYCAKGRGGFENGAFTLKTHQLFSVHTSPEKFKTQQSTVSLHLCLRKTRAGEYHDYRKVIVFEKRGFQKCFLPRLNANPLFANSSGLKSVFEKHRFRDGLVSGVNSRLNRKNIAAFLRFSGVVWTGPQMYLQIPQNKV